MGERCKGRRAGCAVSRNVQPRSACIVYVLPLFLVSRESSTRHWKHHQPTTINSMHIAPSNTQTGQQSHPSSFPLNLPSILLALSSHLSLTLNPITECEKKNQFSRSYDFFLAKIRDAEKHKEIRLC